MQFLQPLKVWLQDVASVPWRDAFATLQERFREDRLGLTASSLTFTTTIALVPFITVALAVFTAFPMFAKFQDVLQKWLIESLVPDNIARQVLGSLNLFAGKASKLGAAGLCVLLITALALIFTIDRTLNSIWRVRTQRPFAQRVLIYWAAITLGPVVLGASLSLTSYALSASKGLVAVLPGGVSLLLDAVQYLVVAGGMACMFCYVPNTRVRWGHAWMGGIFVATGMEVARRMLAWYLGKVPTYSVMYGAFATVPILLVWIYVAWVIVLLGAALTAYIPSLIAGIPRIRAGQGWQFQLSLEVLRALDTARTLNHNGPTATDLCTQLQVDAQRLEPVLEALKALDWVGQLEDSGVGARLVLLVNPDATALQPLVRSLLLPHNAVTEKLWNEAHWPASALRAIL
jgi:membrane protein